MWWLSSYVLLYHIIFTMQIMIAIYLNINIFLIGILVSIVPVHSPLRWLMIYSLFLSSLLFCQIYTHALSLTRTQILLLVFSSLLFSFLTYSINLSACPCTVKIFNMGLTELISTLNEQDQGMLHSGDNCLWSNRIVIVSNTELKLICSALLQYTWYMIYFTCQNTMHFIYPCIYILLSATTWYLK